MSASFTMQKTLSITAAGPQDPDFVVDAGAYRYVAARLKIEGVSGTGSVVIEIEHAAISDDQEFTNLLAFATVTDGSSFPTIEIKTSETFARYLRWNATTMSATAAKINIELVLKN